MLGFTLAATGVGLVVGILVPDTGCILKDYCIRVQNHGQNNCNHLEGAMMWPIGQPELAQPVPGSHDAPGPAGCVCLNSAEQETVDFEAPAGQYAVLMAEIEDATRKACDSIVPAGWDHNCFINEGVGASTLGLIKPFTDGYGACIGTCVFANPPPGESCPELDPYQCNEDDGETGDNGGEGESGGSETGGSGLDAGEYIYCAGTECEIDLKFAQMLYENLEMLQSEGTTLVYESRTDRFVFQGVEGGSLAAELGLWSGDILEAVNGTIIDGLDSALQVAAESRDASELRVRVKRSQKWIDFTYTFVH
jgi:hypothetical protein